MKNLGKSLACCVAVLAVGEAVRIRGDGLLEELIEAESQQLLDGAADAEQNVQLEAAPSPPPKPAAKSEADQKFAEVNSLMAKYDKAEARVKWLNSPEYLKQQEEQER